VKATVTILRGDGNLWYTACPGEKCNRKIGQNVNGMYSCEHCRRDYDHYIPRYVFSFSASDHTGSQWLSCFNDVGEKILGHPATFMEGIKDTPQWTATFYEATHKQYKFKIKALEQEYQGEWRLKCTTISATEINFLKESTNLLNQINQMQ